MAPDEQETTTSLDSTDGGSLRERIVRKLQRFNRSLDFDEASIRAEDFLIDTLVYPPFVERLVKRDTINKGAQWIAAFMLVFVVPLTVSLLKAVSAVMESILSAFGDASEALFFQFLISGLNLAFVAVSFWFWILFVSTGGFGLFEP